MIEGFRLEEIARRLGLLVAAAGGAFAIVFVLFIATTPDEFGVGNWRTTTFGSAIDDPGAFLQTCSTRLTFAGCLFIVASGFALIFGLMRVVNMAHGAFYLLGGYIAYEIQQGMTGQGFRSRRREVNTWEWLIPLLVAAAVHRRRRVVMQQAFCAGTRGRISARR